MSRRTDYQLIVGALRMTLFWMVGCDCTELDGRCSYCRVVAALEAAHRLYEDDRDMALEEVGLRPTCVPTFKELCDWIGGRSEGGGRR